MGGGFSDPALLGDEAMKLRNLFLIAVLTGTMAVVGCGDDPPSEGNGGTGERTTRAVTV